MPKLSVYDVAQFRRILRTQHQVITRAQALEYGMPHATVDRRIAPDGPWRKMLGRQRPRLRVVAFEALG